MQVATHGQIYDDAMIKYNAIRESITAITEAAYEVLYEGSSDISSDSRAHAFAINTMPRTSRQEVIRTPLQGELRSICAQTSSNGQDGFVLVSTSPAAPSLAIPQGLYANIPHVSVTQTGDVFTMANGTISMSIKDGRIASLYDRANKRELIPEGQTGGMVIMEDHPNYWDAWDVDQFHLEKQKHLRFDQIRIAEQGPLVAALSAVVHIGESRMDVEIVMDALPGSLRDDARGMIRFNAMIDWRERHRFLKFELPVAISAESATYDTQFGIVSRPTHRNTSWDAAKWVRPHEEVSGMLMIRFEVCGHKFADYSEFGYGVAILNDCKYGYAVEGNIMRLSLLRGPTQPDPNTDMGTQSFSWAIYPHEGTFAESDVPQVATAFNAPMRREFPSMCRIDK